MHSWQMPVAKARMSGLVKRTQIQPQDITLHGKSVAEKLAVASNSRSSISRVSSPPVTTKGRWQETQRASPSSCRKCEGPLPAGAASGLSGTWTRGSIRSKSP